MYSRAIREEAQLLLLNGMQQVDVMRKITEEHDINVSRQTMSMWAKACYVDADMQLKAAQMRDDASDRAALIIGNAQALLLERLETCIDQQPQLQKALQMLEDAGNAGMVDVDAVAQAVDILQQVSLIPTKELSSIIKDSQAQQLRIGGMEAEHVPVQISFGDVE